MLLDKGFSYKNKPAVLSASLLTVDNIGFSAIINIEGSTTKWLAQKFLAKNNRDLWLRAVIFLH